MSVNKVILVGNLGADPMTSYTNTGTLVANFDLATSERYKDRDGNQTESTEWHKVVAFGKLAEVCGEYLKKGAQVYIEGSIKTREWVDKQKIKRKTTEIIASQMRMLGTAGAGTKEKERPYDKDDVPF